MMWELGIGIHELGFIAIENCDLEIWGLGIGNWELGFGFQGGGRAIVDGGIGYQSVCPSHSVCPSLRPLPIEEATT